MPPITRNTLFYGDNLPILRDYVDTESVDLVYLDPPFNSNRSYNVLFKDESGHEADAQITAFEDAWHWNAHTEQAYRELVTTGEPRVATMIGALREAIGANQMMAYLVMMAVRLVELHRVLKPTGSLYLHCDPTASHYLKIILDVIFGPERFVNEIVWKRTTTHSDAKRWSPVSDTILFCAKSAAFTWNPQFAGHDPKYVADKYRHNDNDGRGPYRLDNMTSPNPRPNMMYEWRGHSSPPNGWRYSKETMAKLDAEGHIWYPDSKDKRPQFKRYLNEMAGRVMDNIWADISPINSQAAERLGYPTQKPLALLERIIQASSNPGDLVLDPFCGCGTAVVAAQKLGRRWIGIDVTHLSIALQKYRLKDAFGLVEKRDYAVVGEPEDLSSARQLSQDDRYQFQWWALSLVRARPTGQPSPDERRRTKDENPSSVVRRPSSVGKKGADRGVDGVITFMDDASGKVKRGLVQVKSGHVKSGDVRDLLGAVEAEAAALGIFVTLEPASREMETAAATAGVYHSPGWERDYPRLQILTVADLLEGAEPKLPPSATTFKAAGKVKAESAKQEGLFGGQAE